MSGNRLKTAVAACASAGLLMMATGCSILPKNEALDVYRLPATAIITEGTPAQGASTAAPTATPTGAPAAWSLRIATPNSSRIVDNDHILVMPQPNLVKTYQGVRWSDPAPVLLRNRLMSAFGSDGRIKYLSSDDSSVQADLELGGELRAFQTEYREGTPTVVILFDARLVQAGTKRIVAAQSFAVRQPVAGTKVPQVVDAFGLAGDQLALQVVDWTMAATANTPMTPSPKK